MARQWHFILQGLASSGWFWFCLLVCAAATVCIALLLRYERQLVSRRVGLTLLTLRMSVLLLLFLTFLQPVLTWELDRDKAGRILVCLDQSASMDTVDQSASKAELLRWARGLELVGGAEMEQHIEDWIASYEKNEEPLWVRPEDASSEQERSRLAAVRKELIEQKIEAVRGMKRREIVERLLLGTSRKVLDELHQIGQVELRTFAGQTQSLDAAALTATLKEPASATLLPQQTSLQAAMEADQSSETSALTGIVLLTDGRHNTGRDPLDAATRAGTLHVPVFPVMIGSEFRPKDISILSIEAPQVVFQNDSPVIRARLAAEGYRSENLTILLKRPDGTDDTQTVRVPSEAQGGPYVEVEFTLPAAEPGTHEFSVRTDVRPDELRPDNNQRSFVVQVVDDKARVLLVDGEARWEFRFIEAALGRDERVELSRVLFNQPYMGLLPATFFPRQLNLPARPEDLERSPLSRTDLIIVGDVAPAEFDDVAWDVMEYFVRETGGTLVLIGGPAHMPQQHHSEAFQRLLPVTHLRPVNLTIGTEDQRPDERGFGLRLTPEGEKQTWLQFDADSIENRTIWSRLPGHFRGLPGVARPGSTVLATAFSPAEVALADERSNAIIVHSYYGFGQVVWLGIDSTWRWRYRVGDQYHHRFWGQLARWAAQSKASAGNEHVRLSLDRTQVEAGDEVIIRTRWQQLYLDQNPGLEAAVEIRAEADDGTGRPQAVVELKPQEGRPSIREGRALNLPAGTWTLKLVTRNAPLKSDVTASLLVTEPLTGELSELSANRELLSRIAEVSSGRFLLPDQLHELPALLRKPEDSASTREETSLWDHWTMLVLFFSLLTTEWAIRKLNGLP